MQDTPNLKAPYLMPSQAQKHVTHNEALRTLDALVQLSVADRDLTAPPEEAADGERFIVAAPATGAWAGRDGQVAAWQDGAWSFYRPLAGWTAWAADEEALLVFDGEAWTRYVAGLADVNPVALAGVNTAADDTNRLAVKSQAVLFSHDETAPAGDVRVKLNKADAADTATFLFQDDWSGRAEIGLAGDDDFHLKVSPDGSAWHEAIVIERAGGRARFPGGGVREQLAADRAYYVRTDGSDANDGLADSAGRAFATIQKAVDAAAALDLGTRAVTIHVGPGTYGEAVALKSYVGAGPVTLLGDTATPANVVIAPSGDYAVTADTVTGRWQVHGFELRGTSGCLYANGGSALSIDHIAFNAGGSQIHVRAGARVDAASGTLRIVNAACARHAYTNLPGSSFAAYQAAYTLPAGGLACTDAFAVSVRCSMNNLGACTFANSGAATGKRYRAEENGIVSAAGGGASFLPGNAAGTTATGGIYT